MNISIFGLGYVGCVGLGCLAEKGHTLIGVDIDPVKVDLINHGKATIVEKDIDELICKNFENNRIRAISDSYEAVRNTECAIICVGTPNNTNGHLDLNHIYAVSEEIGRALKDKNEFFTVAIRSTVMPGTNKAISTIIANSSGKIANKEFAVVSNPEFLREGSAVYDFYNPPYTVIASESVTAIEKMKTVYSVVNGEIIVTDIGTAELIKFVNNSFHGLKVAFANEVGRISKALNIDSRSLMELFVKDTVLNISPYYFKPGFAYGGSCLPKDLKALNSIAHDKYIDVPVLASIERSNQIHIEHALNLIIDKNKRKIGFYGIAFKAGTDDLRFSPSLELAERLIGKGYEVIIYDKNVSLSRLMGKNKEYLYNKLPHINKILAENSDIFFSSCDIVVISNSDIDLSDNLDKLSDKFLIDLARIKKPQADLHYEGICW